MAAQDPETGARLSDEDICDELIIFLFAGHDTTATTLTYALWSLGHHPEYQERVAKEVAALPDRPLTPDDIPQLGYTVQVIRESLRLCPPAPTGTRMANRDVEVGGYLVPKGTMLVVGRMAVQRDPTLWDDPLRFDPERFSPANSKALDRWQYVPFGGGPRSCIGNHFAMLEDHPRPGDHHPRSRNPFTRRRISPHTALHHDCRRADPSPHSAAALERWLGRRPGHPQWSLDRESGLTGGVALSVSARVGEKLVMLPGVFGLGLGVSHPRDAGRQADRLRARRGRSLTIVSPIAAQPVARRDGN